MSKKNNGSEPLNLKTFDVSTSTDNLRTPHCVKCRNHKYEIKLKGHKRYCKYRKCQCILCLVSTQKQKKMAEMTAIKRAHEEDKKKKMLPGEVKPQPFSTIKPMTKKNKISDSNLDALLEYSFYHMKKTYHIPFANLLISLMKTIVKHGLNSKTKLEEVASSIHHDIRNIQLMIQEEQCCYRPRTPNSMEAPTYEGQVPYIGIGTPHIPFQPWTIPWTFNSLTTINTPPFSNSPSESSPMYHW